LASCQRPAHRSHRWCWLASDGGRINAAPYGADKRRMVMLCSNSAHACLASSAAAG
jgi:hypothetical protein